MPSLNILLRTYFESVEYYTDIVSLPVKGIGLDFAHGLNGCSRRRRSAASRKRQKCE
ncbi:hypothetical protein [Paenibacillus taihuensis]|uniref:hypothetical protein n=1 Tax=Paenibacillus taihuensis TaxID=1156355 RepID=UPI000E2483B9